MHVQKSEAGLDPVKSRYFGTNDIAAAAVAVAINHGSFTNNDASHLETFNVQPYQEQTIVDGRISGYIKTALEFF